MQLIGSDSFCLLREMVSQGFVMHFSKILANTLVAAAYAYPQTDLILWSNVLCLWGTVQLHQTKMRMCRFWIHLMKRSALELA